LFKKWESNKENSKIALLLKKLESNYFNNTKDSKERNKWVEYVIIQKFIQLGIKPVNAYKLANPDEPYRTVQKRFLRQKKKAESDYDVDNPNHIQKVKSHWDISDIDNVVF